MDWNAAIDKNREALKRVLATLVGMAALAGGTTLPRRLHRYVLRLLRPAEAAVRRLIIVAARGLVVPPPRPRKPAMARKTGRARVASHDPAAPALPLFDRLSPWTVRARPRATGVPRISVPGYSVPFTIPVRRPDDPIDAAPLNARLGRWPPPSTTCRARQDASPAGGHVSRNRKIPLPLVGRGQGWGYRAAEHRIGHPRPAACGRCAPAGRRAGGANPCTRCTRSWTSCTASPTGCWCRPIRHEGGAFAEQQEDQWPGRKIRSVVMRSFSPDGARTRRRKGHPARSPSRHAARPAFHTGNERVTAFRTIGRSGWASRSFLLNLLKSCVNPSSLEFF